MGIVRASHYSCNNATTSADRPRPTSVVSPRQVRILSVGVVRARDDSCNNALHPARPANPIMPVWCTMRCYPRTR